MAWLWCNSSLHHGPKVGPITAFLSSDLLPAGIVWLHIQFYPAAISLQWKAVEVSVISYDIFKLSFDCNFWSSWSSITFDVRRQLIKGRTFGKKPFNRTNLSFISSGIKIMEIRPYLFSRYHKHQTGSNCRLNCIEKPWHDQLICDTPVSHLGITHIGDQRQKDSGLIHEAP